MDYFGYAFLLCFLPITLCTYWAFKRKVKIQNAVLLIASLIFYAFFDLKYLIILLCCIVLTFFGGFIGHHLKDINQTISKRVYIFTLIINLALLVVFKYTNFVVLSISNLFKFDTSNMVKLILPIGLSFYIFQSSSYLMDLISDKVEVEKNFIDYALFVSFFPTITSGPIQKSRNFLPKLKLERSLSFVQFKKALYIFLWGAFLKLVIADRLAIFTNQVFNNFKDYAGFQLSVSAVFYSIQIYTDFAGYSFMSIGLALFLGFSLEDNFKQPYFATTIADFWRRWHISLTSWFRDYLYIPLGGNRKGTLRKFVNVAIVFTVSGLWHGAAWSFILWGAIHAIYQIVGALTKKPREKLLEKLRIDTSRLSFKIWQQVWVFIFVTLAWIFFRIGNAADGFNYIWRMISTWNPWVLVDKSLYNLGLSQNEFNIALSAISILFVVSYFREKGKTTENVMHQNVIAANIGYFLLVIAIVVFGIYGPNYSAASFIYAGF